MKIQITDNMKYHIIEEMYYNSRQVDDKVLKPSDGFKTTMHHVIYSDASDKSQAILDKKIKDIERKQTSLSLILKARRLADKPQVKTIKEEVLKNITPQTTSIHHENDPKTTYALEAYLKNLNY